MSSDPSPNDVLLSLNDLVAILEHRSTVFSLRCHFEDVAPLLDALWSQTLAELRNLARRDDCAEPMRE